MANGQVFLAALRVNDFNYATVMDTGSADPWLVSADFNCSDPGSGQSISPELCYFGPQYNASASPTFQQTANQFLPHLVRQRRAIDRHHGQRDHVHGRHHGDAATIWGGEQCGVVRRWCVVGPGRSGVVLSYVGIRRHRSVGDDERLATTVQSALHVHVQAIRGSGRLQHGVGT